MNEQRTVVITLTREQWRYIDHHYKKPEESFRKVISSIVREVVADDMREHEPMIFDLREPIA